MIDISWDFIRWVNVALSGLVVVLLIADFIDRWPAMSTRSKRVDPWIILTYLILAYGSGEVARSSTEVPPGIRVTLLLLDLFGLAIALAYRTPGDDDCHHDI